jgi:flagellar hook-associated protein 3 FlgL
MSRITSTSTLNQVLWDLNSNREAVAKYSEQLSSGLAVSEPGDTSTAGTVASLTGVLQQVDSFTTRIASVRSQLDYQNDILTEASELLVRAEEIATQLGNETNDEAERIAAAEEVFEIRDHLVSLANTTYQGMYLFGGAVTTSEPFTQDTDYVNGSDQSLERYAYNVSGADGADTERTVRVTDNLTLTVNTSGDEIFTDAIVALECLGRALQGYRTELDANGLPDGTGTAYNLPDDYDEQSEDILACVDMLDSALSDDIKTEITNIAGRSRRLDTAESLLELSELNAEEVLSSIRDVDMIEAASNLSMAETALEASFTVTSQLLQMTILDYI